MNRPCLSTTVVGLDIGESKICVPVGEIQADGRLRLIGLGQAASRGVIFGQIHDAALTLESTREAVMEAEEMARTKITGVFIGTSVACIKWGQRRILVPRTPDCALHQSIELVLALGLTVAGVVFKGSASGMAVLTSAQKQQGALVIDIGAGMTHYAVFSRGLPINAGVIPIGGNAISYKLASELRYTVACAERSKRSDYNSVLSNGRANRLNPNFNLSGIDFEAIRRITRSEMEKYFRKIRHKTSAVWGSVGAGVFLTGGGSRLAGVDVLCSQVFGSPASIARLANKDYEMKALNHPEFSTGIGLVEYGASLAPRRFGS